MPESPTRIPANTKILNHFETLIHDEKLIQKLFLAFLAFPDLQVVNRSSEVSVGVEDDGVDELRAGGDDGRVGAGFPGGDLLETRGEEGGGDSVEADHGKVQRRLNSLREQLQHHGIPGRVG